jgi:outer membrane protein OmpA-like peptidoglycan-associated protein
VANRATDPMLGELPLAALSGPRWRSCQHLLVFGSLLVALFGLSAPAAAQGRSLQFDLQPFRLTSTSCGLLSVEGTQIGAHLYPRAVVQLSYQRDPLLYRGFGQITAAVGDRVAGEVALSLGLFNRLELGLGLPVVLHQSGDSLSAAPTVGSSPAVSARGLGDLRAVAKGRIFGNGIRGFSLAGLLAVQIPTAQDNTLAGAGFGLTPQLLGGFRWGRLGASLMLGYRLQPERQLYSLTVDDELLFGAGVEVRIWKRLFGLAEITGTTAAASPFAETQTSPLVARAGVRVGIGAFQFTVAGGPGIIAGYGAPKAQLLASVGWVPGGSDADSDGIPDRKDDCPLQAEDKDGFQDADGCPELDNDRDGVPDKFDSCRNEPEDKDGHLDVDGCPDPDNDGDGIPDIKDKCPNAAEDKDGFKDDDGCPDPDNDGDGIPDTKDKCPNKAEVFNGLEDEDGCPEADKDADGILDGKDACPNEAEDKNGLEDDDGCPEDPDGDLIPSHRDRCPNEKETFNGYQDKDGCPDSKTPKVIIRRKEILLSEAIYFDSDKWDVKRRSFRVLYKLAKAIKRDRKIRRIYVEGHADQRGGEKFNQWLSFQRAKTVVRYLRKLGVKRKMLRALGWGQQRPWDTTGTKSSMARNRRVRFHVIRKQRRKPKGTR